MSLQPVLRYSLDLSGSDPDNKVVGEVHSLAPVAPNRSIAPYYGSFYTDGLKVRDVGGIIEATAYTNIPLTGSAPLVIGAVDLGDNPVGFKRIRLANQDVANDNGFYQYQVTGSNYTLTPMALGALLTPGVDYVPTMLQQDATRVSGKEVCQLVVITNETLMNDVVLEYQAVGGEYSVSSDALDQLIATLNLDNRPVVWGEIIGIPNTFPPVDHLHHIQDFKGFGHVVDAIDEIRALLTGGGGTVDTVARSAAAAAQSTANIAANDAATALATANAAASDASTALSTANNAAADAVLAKTQSIVMACSNETDPLTVGADKIKFRMPYDFTLIGIKASLTTAQASGNVFTVDVKRNGNSILSTLLTIDNGAKTSKTASVPAVISIPALLDDQEISVDITQIGDSTAVGLKVTLIGYKTS